LDAAVVELQNVTMFNKYTQ